MSHELASPSDIAFTTSVKAKQLENGSRAGYERFENERGWESRITPILADFIKAQFSMFIATSNKNGQPYIQHRGGPPGFIHVLDDQTLAFADFSGNKQYITIGNLEDNSKAQIFLMDFAHGQRIKVWGEAKVVVGDKELATKVTPVDYKARVERVILFSAKAWDANCSQHIPTLLRIEDVLPEIEMRDRKIASLESEVERLKGKSPVTAA